MKFLCTQENLNKGLSVVSHIASKNISLPILNNILIKADGGIISLISTNLDIGIKTIIRGKIEEDGELTVQARLIAEYINLLSNNIELSNCNMDLVVKADGQESVIRGQSTDDYPILPVVEDVNGIFVDSKVFKDSLSQVIFSASYDDTRPEISGVLMVVDKNSLFLVATDSYRLAEKSLKVDKKTAEEYAVSKIVPLRALQELLRILEEKGDLNIIFSDNQIVFKNGDNVIISRLVEGNYPDYKQIIPEKYKTKVGFDKNELIKLIKAASLFSRAGINDILLNFSKGLINISAVNSQIGENKSNMKVDFEGEDNKIVFNYKYLLDGLQNLPHKKAILEVTDAMTPAILRPFNDKYYLYLIMPIRQ